MVCTPVDSFAAATSNFGPPLGATTALSTDQSTSITAGSMTASSSVAGFVTAPAGGLASSTGLQARQIVNTICSRETELKLVLTFVPKRLFIIELAEGRYWPGPT